MVQLQHFLLVSVLLFGMGVFAVVTRRNAVAILIGVELMLNAANLNFVAFARFSHNALDGQIFAMFSIVTAAATVAVALAIILNIYRNIETIDADQADTLKG
jgi:NADH-quinone oxidoreductase subunit K